MNLMSRLSSRCGPKPKNSSLENEMLQLELSSYGLSPSDWIIKKQSKYFYKIENRLDPGFCFHGMTKATHQRIKWNRIMLKSI